MPEAVWADNVYHEFLKDMWTRCLSTGFIDFTRKDLNKQV
jgi:hypothetical protein